MMQWFLCALGSAFFDSWIHASQKIAVTKNGKDAYSRLKILSASSLIAGSIIGIFTCFFTGMPALKDGFWAVTLVTIVLNTLAYFLLLEAYAIGEYSSVYSMVLLTPVFNLVTSFVLVREVPSPLGMLGVIVTVIGFNMVGKAIKADTKEVAVIQQRRAMKLGIGVAIIWSITANLDKLSAVYSNAWVAPAISFIGMSFSAGLCLLGLTLWHRMRGKEIHRENPVTLHTSQSLKAIMLLGVMQAFGAVVYRYSLLFGLVSYTIAIKRVGILFGVLWGVTIFRETGASQKIKGIIIGLIGVFIILLFGK